MVAQLRIMQPELSSVMSEQEQTAKKLGMVQAALESKTKEAAEQAAAAQQGGSVLAAESESVQAAISRLKRDLLPAPPRGAAAWDGT